ncbi:SPOSA6832_01925 [Sporobolomyces salmonicolor]|uniref:SPOSA6832_01925-mRNA-1:cds n=1 Tax=Sporidiobolus salmonicolor TaxID=5005 RepID=A0A0D6EK86_SPOSA|nr:SPOSA6832_01925 [Sporobolomyces salmonicolor]
MAAAAPAADAQKAIARLEAQVLGQYSLTARTLDDASPSLAPSPRRVPALTRRDSVQIATVVQRLSAVQPALLAELRPLERKLGLILTLFKGEFSLPQHRIAPSSRADSSVWSLLRQREEQELYEEELRQ